MGGIALEIVDIDGDGGNDINIGGRESNNMVWYRGVSSARTNRALRK